MINITKIFTDKQLKTDIPELRPGYIIRVHQKIKEGDKERLQIFEGLIIAKKHGKGINATITVRKISNGIGIERVFPIHSPSIKKIEVIKKTKARRAKLYYTRNLIGKQTRRTEILDTKIQESTPENKVETD